MLSIQKPYVQRNFCYILNMYIHIKVHTKSKNELFNKLKDDHYEAWVKEPAERNLANKRLIELVRENFAGTEKIKLVSGHHSPSKLFSVDFGE